MKQVQLLDNYTASTTDFSEAAQILADFDRSLEVIQINTRDIGLISYVGDSAENEDVMEVAVSQKGDNNSAKMSERMGHPRYPKLTVDVMTRNGRADLAFVNEFKRNGFCLQVGGKILYCSSSVLSTLCTRCNVGGEGFLKNSVKRDTFLAEILSRSAKKAHIIARRSDDGIVKAYGVLGSAYAPIPQSVLMDIKDKSEENLECTAVLRNFVCDNFISRLHIEFPKISDDFAKIYSLPDEVVPGICISTSDVGDSSLTIWGTIRIKSKTGSRPVIFGEYKRKHSGNIDLDAIIDEVSQKIFADFASIPERMVELLSIEIDKPKEAVKAVSKELKLVKLIGKANEQSLVQAMQLEIDDSIGYTAYDIASLFVSSASRIEGMAKSVTLAYEKNIKDVFFIDFNKLGKSTLYLTA